MSRRPRARDGFRERPAMTKDEAIDFDHVSSRSALQIIEAIFARAATGQYPSCPCQPYRDVFTYERWKAQDYQVRRGEKSLRISSFRPIDVGEELPEGKRRKLIPKTLALFCRCQVDWQGEGDPPPPLDIDLAEMEFDDEE